MIGSRSRRTRFRAGGAEPPVLGPLLLLVIVAVGLFLRLYQIGREGLWIDEAFSVWLARHPLDEMVRWVRDVDHHPPLYYTLLGGWMSVIDVGDGGPWVTASIRGLSVLFGVLTIPVLYLLGSRLVNERMGLVSALILAMSPFHVRFAQEARMYTLLTLFASLALYAFVRLYEGWVRAGEIDQPQGSPSGGPLAETCASTVPGPARGSPLPWIGYVVFTAAMLWTHNTAVFFPIAANLLVLGSALRRRGLSPSSSVDLAVPIGWCGPGSVGWLRQWFAAQAAVFLLWLPWLPSLVSQATDVYRRFWLPAPTLGTVLSIVGAFLCDFSPYPPLITVLVDAGLIALALFGVRELRRRWSQPMLVGAVLLTPFVGQWIVSLWRPILYARTLIWASIPLYLLVAAGTSSPELGHAFRISARGASKAALLAVVAVSGVALGNYYHSYEKESWDEAAALVAERVEPEDLLLFNDTWGQIPFDYYFRQLYNPQQDVTVVEHGLPVDLFARGVLEPKMTKQDLPRLRRLVLGRQRVWLVYSHQWYTDPENLIPDALAASLELRQRWAFKGLQVHLYVAD